jgi:AraC family transcriptional regulator of adaptative response/methylated-DNA-[protein]-cysteine methyltransferase
VTDYNQLSEDYQRIEDAIQFLELNYKRHPALKEVADSVNLSEYHFQRLFVRWVGISPKRFLQYLTKENAKRLLEESKSILDVTYETGLSSPGRLHDLFITCEAVTPGEYKNQGQDLTIRYGFHPTPFGECLLAYTKRGICNLIFVSHHDCMGALNNLSNRWLKATLMEDTDATQTLVNQMFSQYIGNGLPRLRLFLNGTNFQIKVWEALLNVPPGYVMSYEDIAFLVSAPKASQAVGNAITNNPIPVIIPCHRVIRKSGEFGNYRYGTARKKALLGWEMAQGYETL